MSNELTPDDMDAMLTEAYPGGERREEPYAVGDEYPPEERHCEHCLCPEVLGVETFLDKVMSDARKRWGN